MSDEKLKLVFVTGLYPPVSKGGGEISTFLIAEGLQARGHEVTVITEQHSHLGLLEKPLFERRHSRVVAKKLSQILPGADIVHAHDFRSALAVSELVAARQFGRSSWLHVTTVRDYAQVCGTTNNTLVDGSRCLCTLHDIRRTQRYREVGWPRRWARAWQYWYNVGYRVRAFEKFEHEIFISDAQRREIEHHPVRSTFGARRALPPHTAVIYNPVPDDFGRGAPGQLGRAGSVLYVGRLEDYKGVRLLLEAWKWVVQTVPHAHLTLIGEGAQKHEYETYVAREGLQYRVTFKGRVPHERMRDEYDAAQVVVAPHVWLEPFGRTVAEAMARGKVVVTANAGGPAEIVQDTVTGFLFPRGSAEGLRDQLRAALMLPELQYRAIGTQAREWVLRNLSVETIVRQHEDFYRNLSAASRT